MFKRDVLRMTPTRKEKTCKQCKTPFMPQRMGQKACSPLCALGLAQSDRAKAEHKAQIRETKARKDAIKTRGQLAKEAQAEVNRYVRLRDRHLGCVSCDKPATWDGQWHASHFRSVGAASAVRFNLWNIHKACSVCNHHLSGNIAGYLPRLIERIGAEKVAWIEQQNQIVRYDIEYLKRVKQVFKKRANRLAKMVK